MAHFRFRAIGRDGKPRQSVVEARDAEDARNRLSGRGWQVEFIEAAVLSRPQPAAPAPTTTSRSWLAVLALLLVAAALALLWFDPYNWEWNWLAK